MIWDIYFIKFYALDKLGDSRFAISGTLISFPFEHSIFISSSKVHNESGTNLTLYTALRPGAITDCPWGYWP